MKVEKNKVVALTYELIVDGKLADKATEERPLDYIHGNHMLLAKFESELEGKVPGESFAFTLSPEEGYGTIDEKNLIDLPKEAFSIEGVVREDLLVVGQVIPMMSNTGQVVQGTVREVGADTVTMDFNHPMAGKTLNFSGKIVSVREATEKELTEGLHGEFAPRERHCHKEGGCCHGEGHGEGDCGCGSEDCHCGEGDCHCGEDGKDCGCGSCEEGK